MDYKPFWTETNEIKPGDANIQVTQVYVWVYTQDKKLIIVSKDGKKWQLPGGHPKPGESIVETAIREVKEESGLDIKYCIQGIKFFGYYNIEASEAGAFVERFLQVRTFLQLDQASTNLKLKVSENQEEPEGARVNYVKAVTMEEACVHISWLKTSGEYLSLQAK